MLNFRHQIQDILKKVFAGYFILQIIVFLFLFVIYYINLDNVKKDIKSEVDNSVTKFKSIFLKYYQQKFTFLIEDLLLVQNTFNKIVKDKIKDRQSFLNTLKDSDFENCENLLTTKSLYTEPWYNVAYKNQTLFKEKSSKIMKGAWIFQDKTTINSLDANSQKVKFKLGILCQMNLFFKRLFDKNIQWKFKMPITIDFIHFSFQDELFYKFPLGNSKSFQNNWEKKNVSSDCIDFDLSKNLYNPKCRDFFQKTNNSTLNITTLIPYVFASTGKLGTEICMKISKPEDFENFDANSKEFYNSIYPAIFCFIINYDDLESLRSQFKGRLSNEKLYIIYPQNDTETIEKSYDDIIYKSKENKTNSGTGNQNKSEPAENQEKKEEEEENSVEKNKEILKILKNFNLQTLYSSDTSLDKYVNYNQELGIPENPTNDFFDILTLNYFKDEILRIYNNLETEENQIKDLNKENLDTKFQEADNLDKLKNILIKDKRSKYIDIYDNTIDKYKTKIQTKILQRIIWITKKIQKMDKNEFFKKGISYQFSVNSTTNILDDSLSKRPLIDLGFYIYPANIEFEYNPKDGKVFKSPETKFFIVLLGKFSNDEIFQNFQLIILKKFVLFLICICFFNIFLWFLLTHMFFYIFFVYFYLIKDLSTRFQNLYYDDRMLAEGKENWSKNMKHQKFVKRLEIENDILHFFNIKSFPDVKMAFSAIEVLDKIKELDIHIKTKPIDEEFMFKLKLLIKSLLKTFDISENIEDLNIDNELIRNICFIKFLNRIEEIKDFKDKSERDKFTNEAYEDEIFFCNKVLNKRKSQNSSESKGKFNFFDKNTNIGNPIVTKDILNLIKKRLEENPLDYKCLKGFRKDIKKINLVDETYIIKENNNNIDIKSEIDRLKILFEKYLGDSKIITFLKLMRDLQYEYCIFKAENKNLVSYNCSLLDKNDNEEVIGKYPYNKSGVVSNNPGDNNYSNFNNFNGDNFSINSQFAKSNIHGSKKFEELPEEEDQLLENEKDEDDIKNLTNELRRYLNNSGEQEDDQGRLKQINSLLLFTGLLIKVNNNNEAVRQISKILELLDKMIEKNNIKNMQYNFSMFIFNCLISEKILYLLSQIADKNELKRSKMIIFINLLDLSPIYNSRLRLYILGDMHKFCLESCNNYNKRIDSKNLKSFYIYKDIIITMMLSRYKVRSLYHSSSEKKKNIILLFDLNFPILKDLIFLEKFKKFFLSKKNQNNDFYISFFDERLFIFSDFLVQENEEKENDLNNEEDIDNDNNFNNDNTKNFRNLNDNEQIHFEIQRENKVNKLENSAINPNANSNNNIKNRENHYLQNMKELKNFNNDDKSSNLNDINDNDKITENLDESLSDGIVPTSSVYDEKSINQSHEEEVKVKFRTKRYDSVNDMTAKIDRANSKTTNNNFRKLFRQQSENKQFFQDKENLQFLDEDNYIVNLFNYYVTEEENLNENASKQNFENFDEEYPDEFLYKEKNSESNRFDVLSDFIKSYSGKKWIGEDYRLDKALINTIKLYDFAMEKNNTNVVISFCNVEVGFSFEKNLIKEFTNLLYNSDCHLILCFYFDEEKFENDVRYKEKLKCFKKLIWQNIVSGKIFLVKNYHCIKFILSSMNFHQFNYLDLLKLNEFIDIMDIDNI